MIPELYKIRVDNGNGFMQSRDKGLVIDIAWKNRFVAILGILYMTVGKRVHTFRTFLLSKMFVFWHCLLYVVTNSRTDKPSSIIRLLSFQMALTSHLHLLRLTKDL